MTPWTLREKALQLLDKWYLILIAFFLSAGSAWGFMHLWPPEHKASQRVYIGIDINRVLDVSSLATYAKSEPFNIDDYKNWQLSQIESIARSQEVAIKTLSELQKKDPYWQAVTPQKFQGMGDLAWRDMGTWRLTISAPDPDLASQGVRVWTSVFISTVSHYVDQAESAFELDGKLRALSDQQIQLTSSLETINHIQGELEKLSLELDKIDDDQRVDHPTRWRLWGWAATSADFTPMWSRILDAFPEEDQPVSAHLKWIDRVQVVLATRKEAIQVSLEKNEEIEEEITNRYLKEIQDSKGLSPNLNIELNASSVERHSMTPGGAAALVGGLIGVLGYLIVFLVTTEATEGEG